MNCLYCSKEFKYQKSKKTKFCSRFCYKTWRKEKDPKLRPKIKCLFCNKEFSKSRWHLKRGEGKFCSRKCYGKYQSELWKKHPELHPSWKGGIKNPRLDKRWEKWRNFCLKRDNYQCVMCGSKKRLEIHHIIPFSKYPEDRYEINNGVTLCHECHRSITKHIPSSKVWKINHPIELAQLIVEEKIK